MARPAPEILVEKINKINYNSLQILKATAVWAVFFQGKPINIRTLNKLSNFTAPKYKKVSFVNRGSAINLAKKLNKEFTTEDFAVVRLEACE